MRTGKTRIKMALGLVCAVIVTSLLVRFWPRERLLFQRSTLIVDTSGWGYGRRFYNSIGIHWLSDDMLLFNRFVGPDTGKSPSGPIGDRIIYRRNVRTGQEEKLPGLTQARENFYTEIVDAQDVSPDGRWYLCSNRWGACLLAEVNGTRSYRYPSQDSSCYRDLYWMADSRHWLENYRVNGESHRLILHDIAHPKFARAIPLRGRGAMYCTLDVVLSPEKAVSMEEPDTDENGHRPPTEPFIFKMLSLDSRAAPIAQYRVMPPKGDDVVQVEVSPQGDRVAWVVTASRLEPIRALLHRIIPSIKAQPISTVELWVSGLNGAHMHEIGHFGIVPGSDDERPYLEMQWLSGGNKLSYEYRDKLYTVPAD